MTASLTDNLPLLSGAPNGIKKLRELILELAVRGKLVPQDPNDEPASEALQRIAEEKAGLVVEGKIKKQKPLSERDGEDPAFELPDGWAWARLAEVVNVLNGRAYKKEELLDAGTPVLRVGNLFTSKHWYYSNLNLEEEKYCNPGDLLFAWSASFGPFIWQGERSIYHYHIWKLDFYAKGELSKYYLYNFLQEQTQAIKAAGHGVSMVHMTKEKMEKLIVPVPPLAEQHRIVAKVDELMALCDRLEAQQADAESAHAQLVQALLDCLTQASDADELATNWQRLAEHFHTLFTTESSINALKQTLLQLAVMGKLVPQDSSDEPASELCKSIEAEKQRLVAAKKIKDTPRLEPVSTDEELFMAPSSWVWVRMGDICRPISSGSTPPSDLFQYDEGIPFLKVYNIRNQEIDFEYKKQFVSPEHHAEKMKRSALVPGDVVMNIVGPPLGKVAIIPNTFPEWNCNQAIVFFGLIAPVSPQYIYTFLKEGSFLKNIALIGTAGQDNISITKSKNIAVPVPPLAEQHRIIAKVDQLMALCDQLKTRLTQARQLNEQLANTLVEQATN